MTKIYRYTGVVMGQADEISVQGFTINRQVTLKGALIGKNTFRVGQSPFLVLFFFFMFGIVIFLP